MNKYRIADYTEETDCDYCGAPLYARDLAFETQDRIYCSPACAKQGEAFEEATNQ